MRPFSSSAGSRTWIGWVLAACMGFVVLALVVAPAYVQGSVRHVIMAGFSAVCHQLPDRSPFVGGVQLAVCHRCLGIYLSIAAAPLIYLVSGRLDGFFERHARYLVLAAVVVPGFDWLGGVLGLWTNTAASRLLTGAVFGGIAGWFLTRACISLCSGSEKSAQAT